MADNPEDFGKFGTGKPASKRFTLRNAVRLFLLVCILLLIPLGVYTWQLLQGSFFENDSPIVKVIKPLPGIGLDKAILKLQIKDAGAGIDEVIVRAEQGSEVRTLHKMDYKSSVKEDLLEIPLEGKKSGFREGRVRITATAFDKSFWSNSGGTDISLDVDFRKPRIEVVTKQHNAVRGGVELVFYRIIGDQDGFSGVAVGPELFPGFLARKLDSDFEQAPDVYFAFFAVPPEFEEKNEAVQVVARDSVGNTSFASMYYRVANRRYRDRKKKVSTEELEKVVSSLYPSFLGDQAKQTGQAAVEYIPAVRAEEFIERFRALVEEYPGIVESALKPLFEKPSETRLWNDRFSRPNGRRVDLNFGDTLAYELDGASLARRRIGGFTYRQSRGESVVATNRGKVVYAGRLGAKGNTIVLDHGFGLATVYSHLKDINRLEGDKVDQGEEIATSGGSGLAFYPQLGFEFRLHGVPVRPAEWWDENWLRGHIEDKIASAKTLLGIKSRKTP